MSYQGEYPKCYFCKEPATHTVIMQTNHEGDYGRTYIGYMAVPVCDKSYCREEAEHMKMMTV